MPRLMLPLSLSYDHRVIDGAAAVRFTTALGEAARRPAGPAGGDPVKRSDPAKAGGAVDLKVPDLGEFKDVAVIDVLVKAGDVVAVDTPLITLESDKATMDVPSTSAGVVAEVTVKAGDKVNTGSLIARLRQRESASAAADAAEASRKEDTATHAPLREAEPFGGEPYMDTVPIEPMPGTAAPPAQATPAAAAAVPSPEVGSAAQAAPAPASAARDFDLVVLGAGPGGYTAAFRAADLGLKVALVERWPQLGGVCLNVGCIPSKALLHAAKVIEDAEAMSAHGIAFGRPAIDAVRLREWKDRVVARLTGGLAGLARQRKVTRDPGQRPVHRPASSCASRASSTRARSASRSASSQRARNLRACPGCPRIRGSSIRPGRSSSTFPAACL